MNCEIMAMQLECVKGDDLLPETMTLNSLTEFMPAATLVHGFTRLPQTLYVFLWGVFLTPGPTLMQMRSFLASVRWVVSDMGTECSMVQARD